MIMTKNHNVARKLLTPSHPQAYFRTNEWQVDECEVDEDIRYGRVKGFRSVKEKSAPVLFLLYSGNGKPVPMYCTSEEVGDVVFSLTSASL